VKTTPLFEPVLGPVRMAFTVYGCAAPQGSSRAYWKPGMRHPVITTDNAKLKPWRQQVTATALSLNLPKLARHVAIQITADFYLKRPPSVPKSRTMPVVKPDADKLLRGCLDALTGVLFEDDAQVVDARARKHYGEPERMEITIEEHS